jgi:TRAP-type C4-dicarboxylate transport system substrate-binding protein
MKARIIAGLAAFALSGGVACAAEPIALKWGFPAPPTSWVNTKGIANWTKEVGPGSGNTIAITVFAGGSVANFRNVYDRLLNSVIDIGFGTYGEVGEVFPKTMVSSLPFEAQATPESGVALWRLYKRGVIADEYQSVKPLAFFSFGMGVVHSTKPITKIDDLKGMKVITTSKSTSDSIQLLGGVPVTMSPSEIYQALQRGVASAGQVSWAGAVVFKINEVTKHHTDVRFGLPGGYFFMNKDSFAKLPEPARGAIDTASGEKLSAAMGRYANEEEEESIAKILAAPGQTREKLDVAEQERWKKLLSPITEEWLKSTPNGSVVLAAYREELAKVRAGM